MVVDGLTADMISSLAEMFVWVVEEFICVDCSVVGSIVGLMIGLQTCLIGGVDL